LFLEIAMLRAPLPFLLLSLALATTLTAPVTLGQTQTQTHDKIVHPAKAKEKAKAKPKPKQKAKPKEKAKQKAKPKEKAKAPAPAPVPAGPKVSTLGGKFSFTLPTGYSAEPMAPGEAERGTAGATGTLYASAKSKRVIIATQTPIPPGVAIGDKNFLAQAAADFVAQQSQATSDFKKLGESDIRIDKLAVRRIDSSGTLGGGPTLGTTFIAGSGQTLSLVQIVSRADDRRGHDTMVQRVLAGQ
jgi:hypothetical protein